MFRVILEKEQLVFSAAHFITFAGGVCERLHGHNYGVRVEVEGPLDDNHYVVDFIALRDATLELVTQLDHHVLLPTLHPEIRVAEQDDEVIATFENRRWVFPRGDCVLLPVANTTAERLAEYLGQRLIDRLAEQGQRIEALRFAVDENRGQWGEWTWRAAATQSDAPC